MHRILIRADLIPDGAIVTKRTGQKEYRLLRRIRIFTPERDANRREILPTSNNVFLQSMDVHQQGDYNEVYGSTELHWKMSTADVMRIVREYAKLKAEQNGGSY